MRLFIAIMIPPSLTGYCRQLQSQFEGIKNTDDFHITLQFLGDGIEKPDKIIENLSRISFTPFEIKMGDAVPFGPTNKPGGIWIECRNNETLRELSGKIQTVLKPLGFKQDKPLRPHITLGRYKSTPKNPPKSIKGASHRFEVNRFELIQSFLEKEGPHYKSLTVFQAS